MLAIKIIIPPVSTHSCAENAVVECRDELTATLGSTLHGQGIAALIGNSNRAIHSLSIGGSHALEFAWDFAKFLAALSAVFNASYLNARILKFNMAVVRSIFDSPATVLSLLGNGSQRERTKQHSHDA